MKTFIPDGYRSSLDLYETQAAIALIKRTFQDNISSMLNLKRVSAPLFVDPQTGLNDNLNGIERPVSFDIPYTGTMAEVVQSLAKWKRYALSRYDFFPGKGLYTDMNAIRRDEELDNLHSIYVDQWDWEKVITKEERNKATLREIVRQIVKCISFTSDLVKAKYHSCEFPEITSEVVFITSEELLGLYPNATPNEREYLFAKEHKTVFIENIGGVLSNGEPHDHRAPDYDDWSLNGDILFYYPVLDCVMEISSMGIRVDEDSIRSQLATTNLTEREKLLYHQMVINKALPYTVGGGIGQSRLCMLLLGKAHIGEVQASIWDDKTNRICEEKKVILL